ncbi:MAG: hypothetical protein KJ955_01395 [Nanoarchaeota archaeon]|nr:hypothetical protein [Nanoarchaeota archaeon]
MKLTTLTALVCLYAGNAGAQEMSSSPFERPQAPVEQKTPEQHYEAVLTKDFMQCLKPIYLGRAPAQRD